MSQTEIRPELLAAFEALKTADTETIDKTLYRIKTLVKDNPTSAEISAIIAIARHDLKPEDDGIITADSSLLMAIHTAVGAEHIAAISNQIPLLSKAGYPWALLMLAGLQTLEATAAFVSALKQRGWPEEPIPNFMNPFTSKASFAAELMPPLLDGSVSGLGCGDRASILLGYLQAGPLPPAISTLARDHAQRDAATYLDIIAPYQRREGIAWRWDEEYCEQKTPLGITLDLLGHLDRGQESVYLLRKAEALWDPYLRLCAALSLLRLGEEPTADAVLAAGEAAETRGDLFEGLKALKRMDLFPLTEISQEKLAEWDMVNWLKFPTELGRAPDEIELMQTIQKQTGPLGGGAWVYYIFRFRCHPPHWSAETGWTAGISGPFRKREFPTTNAWGDTFSKFEKWEDFTAKDHLASIIELMQRWRENSRD